MGDEVDVDRYIKSAAPPTSATFGEGISEQRGHRAIQKLSKSLAQGEHVLFLGKCNNFRPPCDRVVVTTQRILGIHNSNVRAQFPLVEGPTAHFDAGRHTAKFTLSDRSMTFKDVPAGDQSSIRAAISKAFPDKEGQGPSVKLVDAWQGTVIVGGSLGRKAADAVYRQSLEGEAPWLILVSAGSGLLTAYEDRLVIIKTGVWNSFMAGSFGGERSATCHYRDITGLEYNSGIVNGVLEVLTASYSGTQNRDFWQGSNRSFNADSGNPFTASNALPLSKLEYKRALPQMRELRRKIGAAKDPTPPRLTSASSIAGQLAELVRLHETGALTEEEFVAAKSRVLGH